MAQLLLLASLAEAWGSRGEALGARVPQERLSALLLSYKYEEFARQQSTAPRSKPSGSSRSDNSKSGATAKAAKLFVHTSWSANRGR